MLALVGCGGGGGSDTYYDSSSSGGSATTRETVPVIGVYRGSLRDYGQRTWLSFRMKSDGSAIGDLSYDGVTNGIALTGGLVEQSLLFRLVSSEVLIEGYFYGAYSSVSNSDYTRDGVQFYGEWTTPDGRHGIARAWHESWQHQGHTSTWYVEHPDYYLITPAVGVVLTTVPDTYVEDSPEPVIWYEDGSGTVVDPGSPSPPGTTTEPGSGTVSEPEPTVPDDAEVDDWSWTTEPDGSVETPYVDGYDVIERHKHRQRHKVRAVIRQRRPARR